MECTTLTVMVFATSAKKDELGLFWTPVSNIYIFYFSFSFSAELVFLFRLFFGRIK